MWAKGAQNTCGIKLVLLTQDTGRPHSLLGSLLSLQTVLIIHIKRAILLSSLMLWYPIAQHSKSSIAPAMSRGLLSLGG